MSAEEYYATQNPPSTLEEDVEKVRAFIAKHKEEGRRVVLITVSAQLLHNPQVSDLLFPFSPYLVKSGGTTVPLELNV